MNLSNSSAEPNYLTRLGLLSAPFSTANTTGFFFRGEQIEQRLNVLIHLARSSNKVGMLIANKGLGKSALIEQIQHDPNDDLRIVRIAADPSLNRKTLTTYCFHAFGVEEGAPQSSGEMVLKERFKRLRQLNISPVLLIDDVDQLSESNIEIVMGWLSWKDDDDEFLLQAIFTANRSVTQLDTLYGRLQRVDLPSLTEEELSLYLLQRLESSGYKGVSLFSEKEIKGIYLQSSGNLAAVNQLAHQQLSGATSTIPLVPMKKQSVSFRRILLSCLILALLALLVFQDNINALFSMEKSQDNLISDNIVILPDEEPMATIIIDATDEAVTSTEQADRDELTTLLDDLPSSAGDQESNESRVIVPTVPTPKINHSLEHQTEWVQSQNKTNYTFQLMGSWEYDELFEFVDKYQLTGDVAEFESDRQGRIWYALVFGVYESKDEALKASSQWPEPLNTLPSWLRSFEQIHYQIKNKVQE